MSDTIPQKICNRCLQSLPATKEFFFSDRGRRDGLRAECKRCYKAKVPRPLPVPRDLSSEPTKMCNRCLRTLPAHPDYFHVARNRRDGFRAECKQCRKEKIPYPTFLPSVPGGMKVCRQCVRMLPATRDYFHASQDNKDGLYGICKSCLKLRYSQRFSPPADGSMKCCSKCKQSFPATKEHFYADRYSKDGLACRCKACRGAKFSARRVYRDAGSLKLCTVCRQFFPATSDCFVLCSRSSDGLSYRCRKCDREVKRRSACKPESKARHRESSQRWRQANYERYRETKQRYEIHHRDHRLVWLRQYRVTHADEITRRRHRWESTERGRSLRRLAVINRRARKKNAPGFYTPADIQKQYALQDGKCNYCQCDISGGRYHIDHVIPLSRGGSNWPDNLVLACPRCNQRKNNKLLEEWDNR